MSKYENRIFNCRWYSFVFFSNREKKNFSLLESYKNQPSRIKEEIFPGSIKHRKNIHMVVLESFIDPRLIKDVTFLRSPVSEALLPFLINGDFSTVVSPVYGGQTVQAEFELLTGIKALAKINSIEFNVMQGSSINSFINLLKREGYENIGSVAAGSNYYNEKRAYKSIGFDGFNFMEEANDFSVKKGDPHIFDGDIFDYNFKKIKQHIDMKSSPFISYAVGMYGHFPYQRNMEKQPDVIGGNFPDDRIKRIANQFFYRTKVIAKYIQDIIAIDPNSIIYITSDHLPPLFDNKLEYKLDQKTNIAIMIKDKQVINVSGKKYFEIPRMIWDWLQDADDNRHIDDVEMQNLYFKLLAESLPDQ